MYAIYAYIRVVWGVSVGIYFIHGVSGKGTQLTCSQANKYNQIIHTEAGQEMSFMDSIASPI